MSVEVPVPTLGESVSEVDITGEIAILGSPQLRQLVNKAFALFLERGFSLGAINGCHVYLQIRGRREEVRGPCGEDTPLSPKFRVIRAKFAPGRVLPASSTARLTVHVGG